MSGYKTIRYDFVDRTVRLTLDRPDVRNAFDEVLIAELSDALARAAAEPGARVVVITGEGTAFCAGADLRWMRKMKDFTFEENLKDARALAALMRRLYEMPLPTVAAVNGPAIGGGNGLVAACDIVVAVDSAVFSLSEVKIGLVPACIGPYVIERIGVRAARELFLTGERFDAARALDVGLVNHVVPPDRLEARVGEIVDLLLGSGPEALRASKELIRKVPGMDPDRAGRYTAEMIARLRVSPEGQEGISAFFEKRAPAWRE